MISPITQLWRNSATTKREYEYNIWMYLITFVHTTILCRNSSACNARGKWLIFTMKQDTLLFIGTRLFYFMYICNHLEGLYRWQILILNLGPFLLIIVIIFFKFIVYASKNSKDSMVQFIKHKIIITKKFFLLELAPINLWFQQHNNAKFVWF